MPEGKNSSDLESLLPASPITPLNPLIIPPELMVLLNQEARIRNMSLVQFFAAAIDHYIKTVPPTRT